MIWPKIRPLPALVLLALSVWFGLQGGLYAVAADPAPGPLPYLPWVTGAFGVWLALPVPMTAVANVPDPRKQPARFALWHLAGFVVLTLLSTSVRRALCAVVWSTLGMDRALSGWWQEVLRDLPLSAVSYVGMVATFTALRAFHARRESARRTALLELTLAESRARLLVSRLEPDAVFAALNALCDALPDDLDKAEELIAKLAARLRDSLKEADGPVHEPRAPLREQRYATVPDPAHDPGVSWPIVRTAPAFKLLAVCLLIATVQALLVARHTGQPVVAIMATDLGFALGVWLGFPAMQTFVINVPNLRRHFLRGFVMYWLCYAPFVIVCTISVRTARAAAAMLTNAPLAPQAWSVQLLTEQPRVGATYAGVVALLIALRVWDQHYRQEQLANRLEGLVAEARVEALNAQLEPHFLYNALNTVSSLMYEDAARTVPLVASLRDLLEATLGHARPTWSVADERRHTERYLDLIEARFGSRISVAWRLPARFDAAQVPRFALQSLVENAVKHNQTRRGKLHICIDGEALRNALKLSVSDDGSGFALDSSPAGGIKRLEQTLHILHGARGRLTRRNLQPRGARVELLLPWILTP